MASATSVLQIEPRTVSGKAVARLRASGIVPAVVYGRGFETESVQLNEAELSRLTARVSTSTILELQTPSGSYQAIMHDWAKDPVTDRFLHVDFLRIRADEEIDTEVPIEFVGESAVVKEQGGVLVTTLDSIEVRCLPAKLPEKITVDLSVIAEFNAPIRIGDIALPSGVKALGAPESPVVSVTHLQVEAESASTETVPESAKEPAAPADADKGGKDKDSK